ncbi:MAG: O-methyltransferase [Myxococcales bacterium]|nr:O-methyltransferase [Myxococcales bacterium]
MADDQSRTGIRYAAPDIVSFCDRVHAAHDGPLREAFEAPAAAGMPPIMVAPSEGKLLGFLLGLIGARRVVEIGTLAGYSAIRMARALPPDGHLISLEVDPKHASVARQNIERAGLGERVEVRVGQALSLLGELAGEGPFDAVFVDADKEGYCDYGRWARDNLRPGGLLLADNVYLFGNLLADTPTAEAMRRFHEESAAAFESVCVPTPDGLLLARQRGG